MDEDMLEPIQETSLTDAVFEQLKALISSGKLRPGDRIPSERELCEQLGVSRTAVREAKQGLVVMGLLETKSGRGTFVRDDLLELLAEPLNWAIELQRGRVNELIEVRLILETASAALAAQRATDEDRRILRQLVEQQQTAIDQHDMDAFAAADLAMHVAIARAAQNVALMRTNLAIRSLLRAFISAALQKPGTAVAALDIHSDVVDAILEGNAAKAREAMERHLEDLRMRMFQEVIPGA